MDLREKLGEEFERRWKRNARYSLRAFARDLHTHHTTITRILDKRRRITPRTARLVGKRLSLSPSEIDAACVTANADWLARFLEHKRFEPDTRALAVLTGMSIDDVNVALHHLLHTNRIEMKSQQSWSLR